MPKKPATTAKKTAKRRGSPAPAKAVKKAAGKPAKKAVKKPAEKPAKKAVKKPAEKPAKKAVKKPAEKPAKKAVKKPAEKLAKKAIKKPAEKLAKKAKKKSPVVYIPHDGEKYMSKKHLDYFNRLFETMRAKILSSNERLIDAIKDDVQALPDENDRASKESEFTVELRERERERRLLDKIDVSLKRISSKNFGYCSECGDPIGLKRLLARPVATLCIECKNLKEVYEKSGITTDNHHE